MTLEELIQEKNGGLILSVVVKPNSPQQKISLDYSGEHLFVFLTSPPQKGKANKELIKYFSKILKVSSSQISLIAGQTSQDKYLFIANIPKNILVKKLESLLEK
ncbi:MAG: DUF167 domain-containing protein [Asgard group archaeon]|nr:DUF167 domain-containing protein [Asgard group archaeon]